MATVQRITGDISVTGDLSVSGSITGQNRAGIDSDTLQSYQLPIQTFRIWDEYDRNLPDSTAASGLVVAQLRYDATIADTVFFVAGRDYRVAGITAREEVAGTGGACTAIIKKAASATAIASGTALHSSSFNLVGSAATNQTLALSATDAALYIPAGTCIGFDLTGTPTSAVGTVSVFLIPISSDDLCISSGAFATGLGYIHTGDSKALTTQKYARNTFTLPPEYVAGSTVTFRFASGMLTTIADTSARIDLEVYKSARTTLKTGSDLVTSSYTSINSLTFAETTFDLTSAGLAPGDVLDLRVNIAITDAATVTVVKGAIAHAEALLTVQG